MDVTKEIRTKYFQALNGLEYQDVEIPIFVGFLDDSASLPTINRGEVYIVIQDQQAYDSALQPYCTYNVTSDITIRIVSKFTKKGTTSIVEDIAMEVDNRIRGTVKKRDENMIGVGRVRLSVNRLLIENSDTHTSYSKILIYQNDLYLTNN
jgi:hypothetical protein